MKKHFYFIMSFIFWLLMVIGFSDNWLFDVGQESNSDPKFLIHAFFAFSWFTLLVVQTGLVRRKRVNIHMTLGIAGMVVYVGLFVATSYIYLTRLINEGIPGSLAMLNIALFMFATFLIVSGFLIRNQDPERHKTNIIIGTFMLMEPGISRSIGHLFGKGSEPVWLLAYLILFGVFVWHYRKITWQIAIGFSIWLIGTVNIVISMG